MRLAYYALGGGLGHLVRARAFLHTLGLDDQAVILTASDYASDRRVVGDIEMAVAPTSLQQVPGALRDWTLQQLARVHATHLCVDVFPAGILGELCDLPRDLPIEFWHVARLLQWSAYAPCIAGLPPRFRRTFRTEALSAPHAQFLDAHSDEVLDLTLVDPPLVQAEVTASESYWLVVHSGPQAEVAQLLAYADEIRTIESADVPLWVISANAPAQLPPQTRVLDVYPASPYFAAARRIFSAAGFNIMRQTSACRDKHSVMSMPRRFDDQATRARLARRRLAFEKASCTGDL